MQSDYISDLSSDSVHTDSDEDILLEQQLWNDTDVLPCDPQHDDTYVCDSCLKHYLQSLDLPLHDFIDDS